MTLYNELLKINAYTQSCKLFSEAQDFINRESIEKLCNSLAASREKNPSAFWDLFEISLINVGKDLLKHMHGYDSLSFGTERKLFLDLIRTAGDYFTHYSHNVSDSALSQSLSTFQAAGSNLYEHISKQNTSVIKEAKLLTVGGAVTACSPLITIGILVLAGVLATFPPLAIGLCIGSLLYGAALILLYPAKSWRDSLKSQRNVTFFADCQPINKQEGVMKYAAANDATEGKEDIMMQTFPSA